MVAKPHPQPPTKSLGLSRATSENISGRITVYTEFRVT